jgi:hypothetical protein
MVVNVARARRRAALVAALLALAAASLVLARDASGFAEKPVGASAGLDARVSAVSSRPLCRSGWRLGGSARKGYVCTRNGRRRRPSCRAQYQLSARRRAYVCLRQVTASPTPVAPSPSAPAATPVGQPSSPPPSPAPTATSEQILINGAFQLAKQTGEKELAEGFYTHVYYWRIEANGCALIAQNTAECVLLLYKATELVNYDPSSVVNEWRNAIFLLGVYYEYDGAELGYRERLGQIGDWAMGPWKWL